jgi:hypothetical protein
MRQQLQAGYRQKQQLLLQTCSRKLRLVQQKLRRQLERPKARSMARVPGSIAHGRTRFLHALASCLSSALTGGRKRPLQAQGPLLQLPSQPKQLLLLLLQAQSRKCKVLMGLMGVVWMMGVLAAPEGPAGASLPTAATAAVGAMVPVMTAAMVAAAVGMTALATAGRAAAAVGVLAVAAAAHGMGLSSSHHLVGLIL